MKIATILFTYHRSNHTEKVLSALAKNDILPEKLIIFQDGIKDDTNLEGWNKVNKCIESIDWCEKEIHVSQKNMGLAKSVVTGIQHVLQSYDAVIVLEDDCVPERQFMRFMIAALNRYEKEEKVYSVSGYAWDANLIPREGEDAYFNGKFCSWGWGTWKKKWREYVEDFYILKKIKKDAEAHKRLEIWGKSMESMLMGNITGRCDSWAVFWGLKIIEKGGYCLSPYKQLVQNIGFDGSGVHGSVLHARDITVEEELKESFSFPEKVESTKECEEEFRFHFAGKQGEEKLKLYQALLIRWLQMKQQGKRIHVPDSWKDGIAVWGKGPIFDILMNEIHEQISVICIVESRPSASEYSGIPIISMDELPDEVKAIIVIPFFDIDIIRIKVQKMRPDIQVFGIDECLKHSNS